MFERMRNIFGPVAVTVIIGAIALVFVFFGVYNPRSTKGSGSGALAATVNGDGISMAEYSREYSQRTESFQNMMKGKLDPGLLKQLRIGEQVIQDLVRRKLLLQEAVHMGMTAPDAEVREKIQEMPYFKDKEGRFDVSRYNQILEMNHYSASTFEDLIRDDLLRAHVNDFLRARAKVSEAELKDEFVNQEDKRQVDYVALTPETGKKLILVSAQDADDAIKDPKGLGEAKALYERVKMTEYAKPSKKKAVKGAPAPAEFYSFEEVKGKVAVELVRERRMAEAMKLNDALAKEVYEKAKSASPAELKAFVKSKGLELKTSDKFNRQQGYIAGIGEMPDLIDDAFKSPSPIAKEPKLFSGSRAFVVTISSQEFKPDLAGFDKQRAQLEQSVSGRKSEMFFQLWLTDLQKKAKISINKQVTDPRETEED